MRVFKFKKITIMVEPSDGFYNVTGVFARRTKTARSEIEMHYKNLDSMHNALRFDAFRYYYSILKNQE